MGDYWHIKEQDWSIQTNHASHHWPEKPCYAREALESNQKWGCYVWHGIVFLQKTSRIITTF